MSLPGFYTHEVSESIQVVQTHLSFVILTGKYAYKIKKDVNFGFADFSSLDKRKFFCDEELLLNQRLAPELYLRVAPIYQLGDLFTFSGDEQEVVEYAIQMKQFAQSNLFSRLVQRGELTEGHVISIARDLSRFHQCAEASEHISGFGSVEAMRTVADIHYEQACRYVGLVQDQDSFDQIRAFTDSFFSENSDLFSMRIASKKIRECHGDLHLNNICIFNGKTQIFDCLEFNEAFRNSDTFYDAAFLFMDLCFHQKHGIANLFLNSYLEFTGDYESAALLPLFACIRAYIRATVTAFLLDDPVASTSEEYSRIKSTATAYYRLALECSQPRQGRLFLMSGLSGTGKSTIAKDLAQRLEGIHLRSDAIRKHLAEVDLMSRDPTLYTLEMTNKTYDQLNSLGFFLVRRGFNVILDAKYDRANLRSSVLEEAERLGVPWSIVHCSAPLEVLRQRLIDRLASQDDISGATPEMLRSQEANFEDFTISEEKRTIHVDTTHTIELKTIISF